MRKRYIVSLTECERGQCRELIRSRKSGSIVFKRAYVLLGSDVNGEHLTDKELSLRYGVSTRMIENIRKRFVEDGFNRALHGKKREVFREKTFDGKVEPQLIALRCSDAPAGYNKWTLQLLSDTMVSLNYVSGISRESVRQLLKKTKCDLGG